MQNRRNAFLLLRTIASKSQKTGVNCTNKIKAQYMSIFSDVLILIFIVVFFQCTIYSRFNGKGNISI